MEELNRLVSIGNGFDLAHGLRTSYKDFIDWYICESFNQFCTNKGYQDSLIEIKHKYSGQYRTFNEKPKH